MKVDLYLLHFDTPYKHAKHYLGIAHFDVQKRIQEHRNGRGANITKVLKDNNITFTVAKIWYQVERKSETKIKGRGLTEYCPLCSAKPREPRLKL